MQLYFGAIKFNRRNNYNNNNNENNNVVMAADALGKGNTIRHCAADVFSNTAVYYDIIILYYYRVIINNIRLYCYYCTEL